MVEEDSIIFVYHIHNISYCPQEKEFIGELLQFVEFP